MKEAFDKIKTWIVENNKFLLFRLPIFLIIGIVIMFFIENMYNIKGIIFNLGMSSIWIIIGLMVWAFIGYSITSNECPDCGSYTPYELVEGTKEKIKEYYTTRDIYIGSQLQHERYLVKEYKGVFKCKKCGREETREWKKTRRSLLQ